jgi:hypothetical protein
LVRATNGHKKVSTIVAAKDVPRFHQLLSEVMRPGMATLKKRERRRQKNAAE